MFVCALNVKKPKIRTTTAKVINWGIVFLTLLFIKAIIKKRARKI